jgi:hypothetical protein
MSFSLFQLVPSVYKLRDAQIASTMQLLTAAEQAQLASLQAMTSPLSTDEQAQLDALTAKATRGPLQSLLMVIDEQLAAFAEDLDQLYDDQFIETCATWVIPYIGDLIGYQPIHGITATVDDPRSEVANTIAMRRRKGTVLVLEQLARDITGWGAHAVEFFQVLGDTQYMKHVRLWNFYSPDVRGWEPRFYRNSGFSKMTHKVDVHNPASPGLPRYNVQNIGIFLWSLGAYSITEGTPTACSINSPGAVCYRLSSLGMDMPLFHAAISQGDTITAAAKPANVPDWLSRLVLCTDLQKGVGTKYYGQGASLALYLNNQLLNPYQIQVANLSGVDGSWSNLPLPSAAIPGSVTSSSTFTSGETVTQSTSRATATLVGTVPQSGPMTVGPITGTPDATDTWIGQTSSAVFSPTGLPVAVNSPYAALIDPELGRIALPAATAEVADSSTITGLVTSGHFSPDEEVKQNNTGAIATLIGTVAESGPMYVGPISGVADGTSAWVGQTSGAVFAPSIAGSVISGSLDAGEEVKQNSTGAIATLIGTAAESGPMYVGPISGVADGTSAWIGQTSGAVFAPSIAGSVASGSFDAGEEVKQTNTGAIATLIGPVPGLGPMCVGLITGTPDATDTWVGQTSGAVFTPSVAPAASLLVSYFYGFNAEMGGGEYERADGFTVTNEAWIFPYPDTAMPPRYTDLQGALNYVVTLLGVEGQVALEITSSQTYTATTGALSIDLPAETTVEFRAQDGCRPTILLGGEISVTGDKNSQFLINGLLIAAGANMQPGAASSALVHVPANRPGGGTNSLSELNLTHCTLVPGWSVTTAGEPQYPTAPALVAEPSGVEIVTHYSILGGIRAANMVTLNLSDSIVDATDSAGVAYAALDGESGGGALTLTGCTVVGLVHAQVLTLVSDSIFWAAAFSQGAPCRPFTFSVPPFASVYYITPPDAAGDMLVVGTPNPNDPTIQQLLATIPIPNAPNQQICGPVELAPGLEVNAYVPTAAERSGDFSAFAALLTDPSPGSPFPITGGIIPPQRWGEVFAWRISPVPASQWAAPLWSDRMQEGCVRFSFLPAGAQTPRRFKCVEQALASPQPLFFSWRYGNPGYLKMLACTDNSIRRGADDGGEMGAFHFVLAPQRESDLSIRLQEYLPVGLDAGLIYQT